MLENGSKMSTVPVVWANLDFFRRDLNDFCRDWWPWTKPGYITMTRIQCNNQWSGGITVHPVPKNSEYKNPLEKFSPRFFILGGGSRRHPPHWLSSTGPNYQRGVSLIFAGDIEGHFEKKNDAGRSQMGSCSCTTMYRLTGHLQPTWNWSNWASSVLITHPILRIWTSRSTTCSLDWKNNWKVAIFRPTRRSLLPRRPGRTDKVLIFFWVACKG